MDLGLWATWFNLDPATKTTFLDWAHREQSRQGSQDLPLSAEWVAGGSAQPSLACRHHVSTDAARVPLPGRNHGLAHAQGAGLAHIEHAGGGLLRRSSERGHPQVWLARDYEHPLSGHLL